MAQDGASRLITLTFACLLLAAPAASAATKSPKPVRKPGPVVTQSKTVALAPHVLGTVVVACPGKMRAVGGGFEGAPGGLEQTTVTTSRLASPNSWTVSGIRSAPLTTKGGTLTATVQCRLGAPKIRTTTASAVLAGAATPGAVSSGTATASCPWKLKVIAGGFATEVDTVTTLGVIPQESRRLKARAWRVGAVHNNTSPRNLTGYAYCAKTGVSQNSDHVSMNGDLATNSADARGCPPGKHPVSGGFLTSGASLENGGNIVVVLESRLNGRAWRSTGLHSGPLSSGVLRSYVYCG